jgi:putative ABC transport system ATP-binding protein
MLLEIKNLSFKYSAASVPALVLPEFTLSPSERVFIRGRSGSGKSTLLNILSGVLEAPKASVFYKGQDFSLLSPHDRDRIRAAEMGIIFQQFNLLPFLSARENVMLPLLFSHQSDTKDLAARAAELFEHLNLSPSLLDKIVRELSVGQQQRVAVVRALLQKPKLILADEPTSSLDVEVRQKFIELLLSESKAIGAAVLFVSHDPGLEKLFDKTLQLESQAGADL